MFKDHGLFYHSALGSRVIKKKKSKTYSRNPYFFNPHTATPSAFVGAPPSAKRRGSLLPRGRRALVKLLGRGVSKVDWTTTFDFVVKTLLLPLQWFAQSPPMCTSA